MAISKPFYYGACALILMVVGRDVRDVVTSRSTDVLSLIVDNDGPYLFKYLFAAAFFFVGVVHQRHDRKKMNEAQ